MQLFNIVYNSVKAKFVKTRQERFDLQDYCIRNNINLNEIVSDDTWNHLYGAWKFDKSRNKLRNFDITKYCQQKKIRFEDIIDIKCQQKFYGLWARARQNPPRKFSEYMNERKITEIRNMKREARISGYDEWKNSEKFNDSWGKMYSDAENSKRAEIEGWNLNKIEKRKHEEEIIRKYKIRAEIMPKPETKKLEISKSETKKQEVKKQEPSAKTIAHSATKPEKKKGFWSSFGNFIRRMYE